MNRVENAPLPTLVVAATGILWGFYWVPVRELSELGVSGAWGTAAIAFSGAVALFPWLVFKRQLSVVFRSDPSVLFFIALGGGAFALYSIGFLYGQVAIVVLLYFLTPVWSAMIAKFVLGWATPRLRVVAIVVGLIGLGVMLGGDGTVPYPEGLGEWMGFLAGLVWSVASTGIRTRSTLPPASAAFVFTVGACVTASLLAPFLAPFDASLVTAIGPVLGVAFLTGVMWWAISVAALLWSTMQLEPTRVGILLMSEVLVGAITAAIFAGETLSAPELLGGFLVLVAGILEVWPVRATRKAVSRAGPPV